MADSSEPDKSATQNYLLALVRCGQWKVIVYVFIFASLYSCFSAISYTADLACQFRLQMAAGLVVIVLLQALSYGAEKQKVFLLSTSLMLFLNVVSIIVPSWPASGGSANNNRNKDNDGNRLRLLQFNINNRNCQYSRFQSYVRKLNPDVLCLEEYSSGWYQNLKEIKATFPYRLERVRDDSFGVAIFSRYPLQDAQIVPIGKAGVPSAFAHLVCRGKSWSFLVSHPLPPVNSLWYGLRNQQFKAIADFIASDMSSATGKGRSFVMCGDLNCVPWSAHFMAFVAASKLIDSSAGFPIFHLAPTWPVVCWPLRIPLDHVFISEDVALIERTVGPDLGSDHLPVFVQLSNR